MGRQYGLGKYGAGTYDKTTAHTIINMAGNFTIPFTWVGAVSTQRLFVGSTMIRVQFHGNIGHSVVMAMTRMTIPVTFTSQEYIGAFWQEDIPINWSDVPEFWTPVVTQVPPCKVPSWPTP